MSRRLVVDGKVKVLIYWSHSESELEKGDKMSSVTDPNPNDLTMARMKLR